MKNLKNSPTICEDMTKLINISYSKNNKMSGIYYNSYDIVATNGICLFRTKRLPMFKNIADKSVVNLEPVAKTFDMTMFDTYSAVIDKPFPILSSILEKQFNNKLAIKLPEFIAGIKMIKSLIYFDGETFTLHKTNKTIFCLDMAQLKYIFPLCTTNLTMYYSNATDMVKFSWDGELCEFYIMPYKI